MFKIFSRKKPVIFYPQCNFKQRVNIAFDLKTVCQMFKRKFHFLNLSGLAELEGLSVRLVSKQYISELRHDFFVYFEEGQTGNQPKITLDQGLKEKKASIIRFYPNLPEGRHLGMTLLFLILTRGNHFAGFKIDIDVPLEAMQEMTDRMTGFDRTDWTGEARQLKVPTLTPKEVAAVEWYWVNVLRCPAL